MVEETNYFRRLLFFGLLVRQRLRNFESEINLFPKIEADAARSVVCWANRTWGRKRAGFPEAENLCGRSRPVTCTNALSNHWLLSEVGNFYGTYVFGQIVLSVLVACWGESRDSRC